MQMIDISMLFRDDDGRPLEVGLSIGGSLGNVISYRDLRVGHMTRGSAQFLMDRLWEMGIRPSDQGTPGQMKAMDNHLQDMRMLLFRMLEYVLKEHVSMPDMPPPGVLRK